MHELFSLIFKFHKQIGIIIILQKVKGYMATISIKKCASF